MIDLLRKNWRRALSDVLASMLGALGVIFLVSLALSAQNPKLTLLDIFFDYFSGGQVSLAILSVGGVAFIALLRHKPMQPLVAILFYLSLLGPIVLTAILIGLNPGFVRGSLSQTVLDWLWCIFFIVHVVWFIVLTLEPTIPNAQEAGEAQEKRVSAIGMKAQDHVE